MDTQKQIILNMLLDKPFVCVTEMMSAYIPDYRRRLCDLKKDGYQLKGRPCQQHNHKSKILKEWWIIEPPQTHQNELQQENLQKMYFSTSEQFYQNLRQISQGSLL